MKTPITKGRVTALSAVLVLGLALAMSSCGADPSAQNDVGSSDRAKDGSASAASAVTGTTIVYYFHGNQRCYTCRKIESLAETAVRTGFEKELADGAVQWRVVNFQEKDNAHFAKTYKLYSQTLIVSRHFGGKEIAWRNLDLIWKLVRNDDAFIAYVQDEVDALMTAEPE